MHSNILRSIFQASQADVVESRRGCSLGDILRISWLYAILLRSSQSSMSSALGSSSGVAAEDLVLGLAGVGSGRSSVPNVMRSRSRSRSIADSSRFQVIQFSSSSLSFNHLNLFAECFGILEEGMLCVRAQLVAQWRLFVLASSLDSRIVLVLSVSIDSRSRYVVEVFVA